MEEMNTVKILTKNYDLKDGQITLLGDPDSVTAISTLVELEGTKFLIDCGVEPGRTIDFKALDARSVILTHAHFEHVGALPELLAAGKISEVFATPVTLEIMRLMVKENIILNGGTVADYLRFKDRLKRVEKTVAYNTPFCPVKGTNLKAILHDAGHLLGSASVEVESKESRVIISGDLGPSTCSIAGSFNTSWSSEKPVDLVLMECTYGLDNATSCNETVLNKLEEIVKAALDQRSHVLIPSFVVGRTQVIFRLLSKLIEDKRIPDLNVAIDTPSGMQVLKSCAQFERLYEEEALARIACGDESIDFDNLFNLPRGRDQRQLAELDRTMLVLAGSGMSSGRRISQNVKDLVSNPNTLIVYAGSQMAGTPGYEIEKLGIEGQKSEGVIKVGDEEVFVRAKINTLEGISSHAGRDDLKKWLSSIPGVKQVGLFHASGETQKEFASIIADCCN